MPYKCINNVISIVTLIVKYVQHKLMALLSKVCSNELQIKLYKIKINDLIFLFLYRNMIYYLMNLQQIWKIIKSITFINL